MRPSLLLLLALLIVSALTACGGSATPEKLYGSWVNIDAGQVRAFVFAESDDGTYPELADQTPVFYLYSYAEGTTAVMVQRGTYEILEDNLITSVLWDSTGATTGQSFANEILGYDAGHLTIHSDSAADGSREFTKEETLP